MKNSIVKVHAAAASIALLLIILFFSSSLISEINGGPECITTVKNIIFYGIWILIPAMIITGATGAKLAGKAKKGLIATKKKRMPFIAANGILILVPAAIYLRTLALAGDFGTAFYAVQLLELIAGAINITLMVLNFRDGRRISRRKRPHSGSTTLTGGRES